MVNLNLLLKKMQTGALSEFFLQNELSYVGSSGSIAGWLGFSANEDAFWYVPIAGQWEEFPCFLEKDNYYHFDDNGQLWVGNPNMDESFLVMMAQSANELLEGAQLLPLLDESTVNEPLTLEEVRCSELFDLEFCFSSERGLYYVRPEALSEILGQKDYDRVCMAVADTDVHDLLTKDWSWVVQKIEESGLATPVEFTRSDFFLQGGFLENCDSSGFRPWPINLALAARSPWSINYLGDLIRHSDEAPKIMEYLNSFLLRTSPAQDFSLELPSSKLLQFRESVRLRLMGQELKGTLERLVAYIKGQPYLLADRYAKLAREAQDFIQ